MTHNAHSDKYTSSTLVYKLCCHIIKLPPEGITPYYQFALQLLGGVSVSGERDEFTITEKMKKKLVKDGRQKDAVIFSDLHRKLQNSAVLKNRCAVMCLLVSLYNTNSEHLYRTHFNTGLTKFVASTPASLTQDVVNKRINAHSKGLLSDDILSTIYSGKEHQTTCFQALQKRDNNGKKVLHFGGSSEDSNESQSSRAYGSRVAHVAAMFSNKEKQQLVTWSTVKKEKDSVYSPKHKSKENEDHSYSDMSEKLLLRDVLYAAQGIGGKLLTLESSRSNTFVDIKANLSSPVKRLVLRLSEMGWLYNKVSKFCKTQNLEKSLGLVGHSFVAALQQELTEYYQLLAVLQSQLQQESSSDGCQNGSGGLTLHRLSVWFMEPYVHLKVLASVVDSCKGKKGGALASALYAFLQHADPNIQRLIRHLLRVVVLPIYRMLSYWIFCGELEDACGEFFVAANLSAPDCSLWQEKYSLRKAMIPSFLTMDQARKILSIGKAINFLRQVCQDHTSVTGKEVYKEAVDSINVDSLFSQEKDGEFQTLLEMTYRKTGCHVLNILHTEYRLMEHLQAMRHYLLLGQGDFIRHLVDLLEPDLAKSANLLYVHNLSGILESAIRATNAQFDNPDILQRLDVRLLEVSPGDTGWDVFSLDYHVDGPIGTVFTPQCMTSYLRLFNTLWRAKRMEYVLSNIWKGQTTYSRIQNQIPELAPVSYQCYIILSEMVHFVQQMQYYIAFEVMECCWADLLQKISVAQDLDQVISAHEEFLDTLLTRTLLDEESKDLLTQLRAIYDLIIQFQHIQDKFWQQASEQAEAKMKRKSLIESNTKDGTWGTTEQKAIEEEHQFNKFIKSLIPATKAQLRVLAYSYEDMVQKFLLMLTDHDDPNLRFLSFRLDFSEHYKSRNTRLQTSLTYQYRRKSLK